MLSFTISVNIAAAADAGVRDCWRGLRKSAAVGTGTKRKRGAVEL